MEPSGFGLSVKMLEVGGIDHPFHGNHLFPRSKKNTPVQRNPCLVGGLEPWNFMTFHSVGNIGMSSSQLTNSIIVQRGRAQPPTSLSGWWFGTFFIFPLSWE